MRSDAVIPASVPAEVVLIRTEQVAVAVGSVRAYPNAFEFTLHIRLRREAESSWAGHSDPFERHRPRRGTQWNDDQLRLGILYADGRRAATTGVHYRLPDDDDDGRLVLQQGGGGGSSCSQDWDFWAVAVRPNFTGFRSGAERHRPGRAIPRAKADRLRATAAQPWCSAWSSGVRLGDWMAGHDGGGIASLTSASTARLQHRHAQDHDLQVTY